MAHQTIEEELESLLTIMNIEGGICSECYLYKLDDLDRFYYETNYGLGSAMEISFNTTGTETFLSKGV